MAPKKTAVTSKSLQALLTRIGCASSGTKSTLLARFQRDIQRPGIKYRQYERDLKRPVTESHKLRIMSIDMGIKNLAFCDAEVTLSSHGSSNQIGFDAHVDILRWKKLDLIGSRLSKGAGSTSKHVQMAIDEVDGDGNLFSPSVLSKTAYHLIVTEVLSVRPDVILIEKQRWRSGGGSAVQQWTLRVNTLEAMLWAVLETLKQSRQPSSDRGNLTGEYDYQVHAVDPKRVGQYWLGQHARALQERDQDGLALDVTALAREAEGSEDTEDDETLTKKNKKPSRSKAEKSAKIAILRTWLADDVMSTSPSTPSATPRITFSIDASAVSTVDALLPKAKAPRRRKTSKLADEGMVLTEDVPAAEIKKLDDITDCFLQAAAWVAWESNRLQLLAMTEDIKSTKSAPVDVERILEMIKECGEA